MVRSKRLRDHEVTNLVLDESQTNGDNSSPILQSTSLDSEPSSDRSPASDSESLESQPQVEEEVEIERDDTVEIIDEKGNVKKKRMMRAKDVWTLLASEKIKVECNQFGQPIKKAGGILGGWLGTVARRGNICPIHYISWKIMPTDPFKLKIINITRLKQVLFVGMNKTFIIVKKWKDYKYDLKAKSKINQHTQQEENAMNAIAASSAAEPSKSSTNLENDYIKNTLKRDKYGQVLGYGNGPTPTKIFGLQSQLRDIDNEQEDPMKEEVKRLKAKIEVMQNKHDSDMLEIKSLLRQLVGQSVNSSTDIRDPAPS
uniref:Transposase Tnp1/En/Spm-like domain-containing protein n=1 Tax=Ananas comosus var. bracteatus TaxID=296719 RepID=A0A6V7QBR4_ANACO|nr:unnamed protein product [Ananas comosus var. bracteatus]